MSKGTVVQVDGKIMWLAPEGVLKAVVIPGKLVNLLTKIDEPHEQPPTDISIAIPEVSSIDP